MDDLEVIGLRTFLFILLVCLIVSFWPARRNRKRGLPPPSSACDRKYDAGWWS